jgi:cellulose synthase/poly-beta-1,6-N-acetylglucosamine synthase-like glycosyltransferase
VNWLSGLVPFFQAVGVKAVGGSVKGYFQKSALDRYENAFSSLNMGNRFMMEEKSASSFYVPTANLLVSRDAFQAAGGFNEDMHVGEDVDFCWRLREKDFNLIYAPFGKVAHKHRNKLGKMLKRRMDYGSSEALLYKAHRDKKKSFSISIFSGLSFLALVLAVLLLNPYPMTAIPVFFLVDLFVKSVYKRKEISPTFFQVAASLLRSYFFFFYYAFYHLIRYYLVVGIIFGFLWWPLWILGALGLVWASVVDYVVKKPELFFPVFFFYYLFEQLAYQIGVVWGCIKYGYFGSYALAFKGI